MDVIKSECVRCTTSHRDYLCMFEKENLGADRAPFRRKGPAGHDCAHPNL